jgi:transposase
MRYDITDFEWSVIEPLLPKNRRGVKAQRTIGVFSTASSGFCALVHRGAIFPNDMGLTPRPITASIGGDVSGLSSIWKE